MLQHALQLQLKATIKLSRIAKKHSTGAKILQNFTEIL